MVKVNDTKSVDVRGFGPHSSLSSDGSFVVLERSTTQTPTDQIASHERQPMELPSFPPHSSFNGGASRLESQVSHNASLISSLVPSSLSPEEIQKKLEEVLQENVDLKENLYQNSLAMKQQLNTLVKWREEMLNVQQNHKAKFAETKELVLKLRAENAELKKIVESYKSEGSEIPSASETELKMENVVLKGRIAELEQKLSIPIPRKDLGGPPSKREQELSALLEQVNRQLETVERSKRQLIVDLERSVAQKTRLERDFNAQKTEMDEQKEHLRISAREKEELEKKITCLMQKNPQETSSASENEKRSSSGPSVREYERLVSQLDEQKALINTLTYQLKEEKAKVAAGKITTTEQAALTRTGLKGCEQQLEQIHTCLDKESERYVSLENWLQEASSNVNQWKGKQTLDIQTVNVMKSEIQNLKDLLAQEQALNMEKKCSLNETQKQFQTLLENYKANLIELESIHKKDEHNSAYHEIQTRGFTEKIDSITCQLMNKEEALAQKMEEVVQLKEKLKKLELENEAIAILKAQVEVYQFDFNAEREARENLAGEKERLAEDVRSLQRRNQQLLDDLETYQQNQFDQIQRRSPSPAIVTTPFAGNSLLNSVAKSKRKKEETPVRTSPIRQVSPARLSPGPQPMETIMQWKQQQRQELELPLKIYEEEIPPPKRFSCPVCNMEFTQLDLLEYHVETCLE